MKTKQTPPNVFVVKGKKERRGKLYSRLLILFMFFFSMQAFSQTVRYQNSVRGGFAIAANGLQQTQGSFSTPYVNNCGGTNASSYSDLILPAGSTIVKAILYVEGYISGTTYITSVKFKPPGAASYTTLNNLSPGFIAKTNTTSGSGYCQFIIDVTNMIPVTTGYVSTLTAGGNAATTGRYCVADPAPITTSNFGYGWALYVVYTNPNSKYRNITIADACNNFASGSAVTMNIPNVAVPSCGTVNAVVGVTGCWGDPGTSYEDEVQLGKTGTTLTALADPDTGLTNNALNSTIGIGSQNNVSADGGPAMSGNYTGRNPYDNFITGSPGNHSSNYDADIFNASGILPPSTTPISVTFRQHAIDSDVLGTGAYAVSIDIVGACLSKTVSPSVIPDGGTATYVFTIANTAPCGIDLTGIGFTDNLPGSLRVKNPNGVFLNGGTGGVVTAVAGSSTVSLSGLNLAIGQTAILTVNVTNVAGLTNGSCITNPAGFTNSYANISGNTANLLFCGTPQCLIVGSPLPVELNNFKVIPLVNGNNKLIWSTLSESNSDYFVLEKSINGTDFYTMDELKAAGNSSATLNYSSLDKSTSLVTVYYRLKLVDRDGQFTYSETLFLQNDQNQDLIVIYPNPSLTGHFKVEMDNFEDPKEIQVYNNQGVLVHQFKIQQEKELEIDLSALINGIYHVRLIGNSMIADRKICIQKSK